MIACLKARLTNLLEDNRRESLQLALWGAHRQCLRDDEANMAAIYADVEHRWPTVSAWIEERIHASARS